MNYLISLFLTSLGVNDDKSIYYWKVKIGNQVIACGQALSKKDAKSFLEKTITDLNDALMRNLESIRCNVSDEEEGKENNAYA